MKYLELRKEISQNLFTILDVEKKFYFEKKGSLRVQLSRFIQKGWLIQLKRGLYCFSPAKLEEFVLANQLYQPSYISLETALNYYGTIPDVSQALTSVSLTTTKKISNQFGVFHYAKIKSALFWGYTRKRLAGKDDFFLIAQKEKALLDFFYLRKVNRTRGLRLDLTDFDFNHYQQYVKNFPAWVRAIRLP